MMNEHSPAMCPQCGAQVADEAAGALCPRCLMAMNAAPETELPGAERRPARHEENSLLHTGA